MLTQADIDFMRQSRREITEGRKEPVVLFYETVVGKDPFTGEEIVEEVRTNVDAIVTEMSGEDHVVENGVELTRGDLAVKVDYDLISAHYDNYQNIEYNGNLYTIAAADRKGIGHHNRVNYIAKREV